LGNGSNNQHCAKPRDGRAKAHGVGGALERLDDWSDRSTDTETLVNTTATDASQSFDMVIGI